MATLKLSIQLIRILDRCQQITVWVEYCDTLQDTKLGDWEGSMWHLWKWTKKIKKKKIEYSST